MSIALQGMGVSKGIAIGRVHIIDRDQIEVNQVILAKQDIDSEIVRFESALGLAHQQLKRIRDNLPADKSTEIAGFIDAHLLMLEDSLLTQAPIALIREHQCNAEWALKLQRDNLVRIFDEMDDPYLSSRKMDVEHVIARVQRILRGYTELSSEPFDNAANAIVLADDLTPADTVLMQHHGVLAFATEFGGTTSHTAILARSLGIPAIVGLRRARPYIRPMDTLIVDGSQGLVIVDPDERTLDYYRQRQREDKRYRAGLTKIKETPTVTLDGTPITLHANIEFPEDMIAVRRVGGEGIGLYRTEFLFMNRSHPPDEEEHLDAYTRVIKALKGGPITIRTLDLGADKQVESTRQTLLTANPALGLRAIRLCLKDLRLFKPQLRAILRASSLGRVRMLIPMVCEVQELIQVTNLLKEVRKELSQESLKFDPNMPLGAMIEVPAMAVCTDIFAKHVDFFSIGTNDLIQYTLAIDRVDDAVNYLYDPLHPAVLRLIKMSIDAANRLDKPISMCGEMASDSRYIRLLLGLGLRSFSVNPEALLEVKQIINNTNMQGLARFANRILKSSTPAEAMKILNSMNQID